MEIEEYRESKVSYEAILDELNEQALGIERELEYNLECDQNLMVEVLKFVGMKQEAVQWVKINRTIKVLEKLPKLIPYIFRENPNTTNKELQKYPYIEKTIAEAERIAKEMRFNNIDEAYEHLSKQLMKGDLK